MPKDPVCSSYVGTDTPFKEDFEGVTYFFCSQDCMDEFMENFDDYLTVKEEERIDIED